MLDQAEPKGPRNGRSAYPFPGLDAAVLRASTLCAIEGDLRAYGKATGDNERYSYVLAAIEELLQERRAEATRIQVFR
jgi:hypothetical protein